MKPKWLYIPLVLSLAINAGALVSVGVNFARDRKVEADFGRALVSGRRGVRQLDSLFKYGVDTIRPLRAERRLQRQALGGLVLATEFDSARAESVLARIRILDRAEHMTAVNFGWRRRQLARPDLVAKWRARAQAAHDSLVRRLASAGRKP
jgi:hypothetical protein